MADIIVERLATLETKAETNDDLHKKLNGNLEKIWETLDEIRYDMGRRLPLWATFLITGLFSFVTGLGVYLLTH